MRLVFAVLLLSACSTFSVKPAQAPTSARMAISPEQLAERAACDRLDNKQIGWTATSIGFGVLSGAGGLVTAVFDQSAPRYATGSISLVLAVGMAVTSYLSKVYTRLYTDRCVTTPSTVIQPDPVKP